MNYFEQLILRSSASQAGHYGKNGQAIIADSLVETKMHCIKLLGDKLCARNFQSQVNEMHARVAVLNKFSELGRPHTQVVN